MEAIELITERKGAVLSPTRNPAGAGRAAVDPEVAAERPRTG
jgi:hypothetical protein